MLVDGTAPIGYTGLLQVCYLFHIYLLNASNPLPRIADNFASIF